jgi:hypothetical protein
MSEVRKQIEKINKTAKKARRINNILWAIVVVLVGFSFYQTFEAIDARNQANDLATRNDSLRIEAQNAKDDLIENINKARETLWNNAKAMKSLDGYSYYLTIYGKEDVNYDEAMAGLAGLFAETGYSQIRDSNGSMYFDEKLNSDLGEYMVAVMDVNVNTGVRGSDDFPNARDKRGHRIQMGQVVQILERIEFGSAVWAKIGYTNRF